MMSAIAASSSASLPGLALVSLLFLSSSLISFDVTGSGGGGGLSFTALSCYSNERGSDATLFTLTVILGEFFNLLFLAESYSSKLSLSFIAFIASSEGRGGGGPLARGGGGRGA